MNTTPLPLRFLTSFAAALLLGPASAATSYTIQWQTHAFSTIVTSDGTPIPETGFSFQLGSFGTFIPTPSNVDLWATNWNLFAPADYAVTTHLNEDETTFVSREISLEATWDDPGGTGGGSDFNFSEQRAYFWIRNSDTMQPDSEWLLLQSEEWVFPQGGECCGSQFPIQWGPDPGQTPVWGRQDNMTGGGTASDPISGTSVLQSYTLDASPIPEVSSSFVGLVIMAGFITRRKRPGIAE